MHARRDPQPGLVAGFGFGAVVLPALELRELGEEWIQRARVRGMAAFPLLAPEGIETLLLIDGLRSIVRYHSVEIEGDSKLGVLGGIIAEPGGNNLAGRAPSAHGTPYASSWLADRNKAALNASR